MPDYDERVRAGEYVDAEGKVLGTHAGFVNYTIGQRKGLGIALGHPAYVTRIDADTNRVTLGSNDDMYASSLRFRLITPIKPIPDPAKPIMAKIRYRSKAIQLPPCGGEELCSIGRPVDGRRTLPGRGLLSVLLRARLGRHARSVRRPLSGQPPSRRRNNHLDYRPFALLTDRVQIAGYAC